MAFRHQEMTEVTEPRILTGRKDRKNGKLWAKSGQH